MTRRGQVYYHAPSDGKDGYLYVLANDNALFDGFETAKSDKGTCRMVISKNLGNSPWENGNGDLLVGDIPEKLLPDYKTSVLPDSIQERITKGDFGCRKSDVQALIEAVYKEVKK